MELLKLVTQNQVNFTPLQTYASESVEENLSGSISLYP